MSWPKRLDGILSLFDSLGEGERRSLLLHYAEGVKKWSPAGCEVFDFEEVRKDAECSDTVGLHLRIDGGGCVHFRVSLGPEVQTLTRAMTSILCEGLEGAMPEEILGLTEDFIPVIVGGELMRQRSRTVYYVLGRMKEALEAWHRVRRKS